MGSREEHNYRENKCANRISNFIGGLRENNCSSYNNTDTLEQISNDMNVGSSFIDIFDISTNCCLAL